MFVCPECATRQPQAPLCTFCGYDGLLDLDNERHVELLRDIDMRQRDRYESRMRMVAVAIAMISVVALWCVPGFWSARSRAFAMPFLADQWLLMAVIGFGITKIADRFAPRGRFS